MGGNQRTRGTGRRRCRHRLDARRRLEPRQVRVEDSAIHGGRLAGDRQHGWRARRVGRRRRQWLPGGERRRMGRGSAILGARSRPQANYGSGGPANDRGRIRCGERGSQMAATAWRQAIGTDRCVRIFMDVPSPSIRWTARSECLAVEDISCALHKAEVVKDNPYRTIYRVHAAGYDWHIKHCKVRGVRAWLREWLRPAKAELEFRQLSEAWRRGVPTIEPLAFGKMPAPLPADSYLVTRTVDKAAPLNSFLENLPAIGRSQRIRMAQLLGTFVAAIHHAGLNHPDLHPGNILVRMIDENPEFSLIDLHNVSFGRPLSRRARLRNLVLFNHWFALRTHRTDRLRFWRNYIVERFRLAQQSVMDWNDCRTLEHRTRSSNLRFWRSRITRCVGASRHFV